MIRARNLIYFTVALALVLGAAYQLKSQPWLTKGERPAALHRVESKRHVAIQIGKQWKSFQLSGNVSAVKLLSNAVVEPNSIQQLSPTRIEPRQGHRYAIEYELLDENDNSIRRETYHFHSNPKEKRVPGSGEVFQSFQLAGSDGLVTQTRVMETPIVEELKNVRIIRLRIGEIDNSIVDVLARVFCISIRKNYDRYGAWESISKHRKEKLASHSVYKPGLLDEDSRRGLMKWKSERATPIGKFERKYLYTFGDNNSPEVAETPLPMGTIVQPGWKIVVPVTNVASSIRVEATPIGGNPANIGKLHFRFDDPISSSRKTGSLDFNPTGNSNTSCVVLHDAIGLVEMEVDHEVALRFFHGDPSTPQDEWPEVDWEPGQIPLYVADESPVVYSISHFENRVTPLKVAFRFTEDHYLDAAAKNAEITRPRRVHWRYIGDKGQLVNEGSEDLNPEVSTHERFRKDRHNIAVTDPIERWFPVPPQVAKVEFWSPESPALVNAWARPNGLQTRTRVPEDYDKVARLESPLRRWFVIYPENSSQYVSDCRALNLKVQPRLAEIEAEEETEDLVWNRFTPKGDWLAARILVPAIDPLKFTSEKPDSVWLWHELKSNERVSWSTLERTSHYNNAKVAFLSDRPAGKIEIWSDEKIVASKTFASTRGEFEINLPQSDGKLRIVSGEGVRVFVSGLEMDTQNAWFRRTAMRVEQSPTVFEYQKKTQGDEYLTLTLYRHDSETTRAGITAKIIPHEAESASHQPRDAWTIRNRSYDVRPISVATSLLMDRPDKLDSGSRCFMKLGSDLPPGKYNIEVQREDKQSGYLLLYQTAPAENSVRRIGIYDNRNHQ